jgi:hypothetical protein
VDTLNLEMERLVARHITLDAKHLTPAVASLARLGYSRAAIEMRALIAKNQTGPCAEITPEGGG